MTPQYKRIDIARFAMMLPVCIISYGLPTQVGAYFRVLCGIASIAFYIFSGFLIMRPDKPLEEKLLRAIRRMACLALGILVLNLIANAVYFRLMGISLLQTLGGMVISKRFWFEFLVMNIWHLPLGENFWFIQSLLYAYIVMYLLCKVGLLKYDWLICLICLICLAGTILAGELAGVIGFSVLGYQYIPANFITRALPYLLLGGLLRQKREEIAKKGGPIDFLLLIATGIVIAIGEVLVLNKAGKLVYTGHLFGNGIAAVGLCTLVIMDEFTRFRNNDSVFPMENLRWYTTFIYATHQLIGTAVMTLLAVVAPVRLNYAGLYMAFLVFILSLLMAVLTKLIFDGVSGLIRNKPAEDNVKA